MPSVFYDVVQSKINKPYVVRLFIVYKLASEMINCFILFVKILVGIVFVGENSIFFTGGLVL